MEDRPTIRGPESRIESIEMNRKQLLIFVVALLAIGCNADVCVIPAIKTTRVEGYVISRIHGKYEFHDKAEIRVLRLDGTPLARGVVDQTGHFKIENLPAGKYWLSSRSAGLPHAEVELTLVAEHMKRSSGVRMILVIMSYEVAGCHGSSITLRSHSEIKKVLLDAKGAQ